LKTTKTNELPVPHRILYISLDGMTDPLGQSQVLPYLKGLSQKGFQITLLSLEKKERFTAHKSLIKSICQEAHINWQPIFYSQAIPVLSSVFNVFKLNRKAFSLQKQIDFSIVHCRNYVCSIVGLKLKQQFGLKFICDTRGFWHEERLSGFRDKFLVGTIFTYFVQQEKAFFAQADCIVTLNQTAKEEIEQRIEFDKKKTNIEVIPCCVDYELFTPLSSQERKSLKKSLNIELEDVVLGYVGSIGTIYMLDEMLDFFKIMLKKLAKAKFFIITLESPQTILQKARQRDIPLETLIIKAATRKEVSLYLNTVAIAISFIKPIYEKRGCSPTKIGEYWAMNIPVIANDGVGDIGKIMQDTEGGTLITEFSKEAYSEALEKTLPLKNKDLSIREKSKIYYDLTQGVETYHKIYTQLA
jgi:glycosyltransferase involved in cell wall biosynthesis